MTAVAQHQQAEPHYADPTLKQPFNMQQPETAKNVMVYMNGDKYYPGRRFVVNRRHIADFDGFLNLVTNGLKPSFGAVRNIYTPNYGHKVTELEGLNNGMSLVAGGVERFRKLQYQEITAPSRKPGKPKTNYATIRPVYHNQRMNVAARWKDVAKGPCNIYVYANGDINGSAVKLLLIPRIMKRMDMVLQEVTEKLASRTGQAVRRLVTMNGALITGAEQLENGGYYVAVANEKFKRLPYGERAQHMALMQHHPKKPQGQLPPIRRRVRTLNSTKPDDPSYSQKFAARRQFEDERAQQSQPPPGASRHPPNRKLRPLRGGPAPPPSSETESVFHAKPVKVKRSGASGKLTRVSANENEDDVFRARQGQIKAEEVADDEDTKVDLPIDQVPADTVEDEEELDVPVKHEEGDHQERSPSPPPKKTYATRLEEDDSEAPEPSKTPTSARREGPEPSARSEETTEPNGSIVQPSEEPEPSQEPPSKSKSEDEAAVMIQSAYKGYRVRRDLQKRKETEAPLVEEEGHRDEDVASLKNDTQEEHDPTPAPEVNDGPEKEATEETPREDHQRSADEQQDDDVPAVKETSKPASPEVGAGETATTEQSEEPEDNKVDDQPLSLTEDQLARKSRSPSPQAQPAATEPQLQTQSPVDEGTLEEPRSDSPHEQEQSSPRPGSQASAKDDVASQHAEETSTLPERDAGDGTEETEQQQPNGVVTQNGKTPSESQEIKPSQDSTSRPGSVTPNGDGGQAEHAQKSPPDAEQIPNGQPAIIEGGV